MQNIQLLVVDEDMRMLSLFSDIFSQPSFVVHTATNIESAWRIFRYNAIQLVICEQYHFELLKKTKEISVIPVVIVSNFLEASLRIKAFQLGADDVIAKPFNPLELKLRVKRLIRYFYTESEKNTYFEHLRYSFIAVNLVTKQVLVDRKKVALTPREFQLLVFLMQRPKQVFTRKELLHEVWHYTYFGEERTVDNHIKKLRDKLGEYSLKAARTIVTVRNKGYVFNPDVENEE